jgi:hypothetical protein
VEKKARRKRENDKKSAPGGAIIDVYVFFFSNAKSLILLTNFDFFLFLLTSEHPSRKYSITLFSQTDDTLCSPIIVERIREIFIFVIFGTFTNF